MKWIKIVILRSKFCKVLQDKIRIIYLLKRNFLLRSSAATTECPGKGEQILHHHVAVKIQRSYIGVLRKQITDFAEIITNGHIAILTKGEEPTGFF